VPFATLHPAAGGLHRDRRPRRTSIPLRAALLAVALAVAAPGAQAIEPPPEEQPLPAEPYAGTHYPVDDHDPTEAGHPLRIAAYALHPVGVALDWILVRPAVWVVRHEPFRTLFGYQD
jgi:hypothetical protein